jgi:hypothetical protein
VPQLHFYVPEETARALRRKAKAEGVSLSKYIGKVVAKEVEDKGWPPGYFDYFRKNPLPDDFEIPEPPPLEKRNWDWD